MLLYEIIFQTFLYKEIIGQAISRRKGKQQATFYESMPYENCLKKNKHQPFATISYVHHKAICCNHCLVDHQCLSVEFNGYYDKCYLYDIDRRDLEDDDFSQYNDCQYMDTVCVVK